MTRESTILPVDVRQRLDRRRRVWETLQAQADRAHAAMVAECVKAHVREGYPMATIAAQVGYTKERVRQWVRAAAERRAS